MKHLAQGRPGAGNASQGTPQNPTLSQTPPQRHFLCKMPTAIKSLDFLALELLPLPSPSARGSVLAVSAGRTPLSWGSICIRLISEGFRLYLSTCSSGLGLLLLLSRHLGRELQSRQDGPSSKGMECKVWEACWNRYVCTHIPDLLPLVSVAAQDRSSCSDLCFSMPVALAFQQESFLPGLCKYSVHCRSLFALRSPPLCFD